MSEGNEGTEQGGEQQGGGEGTPQVQVDTGGGDANIDTGGGQSQADERQEQAEGVAAQIEEHQGERVQRGASGAIEGK